MHSDFAFVDFEGDPRVPLAQRRAKQSPLRDVAAMLCSLDQVRDAALLAGVQPDADPARRDALAAQWLRTVREAFLGAYAESALATGGWPDSLALDAARPWLALFEIERIAQLLCDEIPQRPATAAGLLASLADRLDA